MSDLGKNLKFSIEWEDPCAAKGDELRATWCRLAISIGETSITRIEDERAQTVRDAVYCPAYPLAEWFAFNWWSLFNEMERPSSSLEKHDLHFAREGFALPRLELFSEDSFVRAVWRSYKPQSTPVSFLNEGFAILEKQSTVKEITTFIDKVVARLIAIGVSNTPLIEEWTSIRKISGDELLFCETVGALGLDPYDLDDQKADEIISISTDLPTELRREFFLAADAESLTQQKEWVKACLLKLEDFTTKTKFAGKKGSYGNLHPASTPWQAGYELARKFRIDFGIGQKLDKAVDIEKLCGVRSGGIPVIRIGEERQLDAVTRLSNDAGPQVATSKTRPSSKSYLLARSICDYLCTASEESALLTRVSSDKQKRNRAFAAELLAPAEGIRKHLSGAETTHEEIAEIADYYQTSEWLIEHQVRNHRLATIDDTSTRLAFGYSE